MKTITDSTQTQFFIEEARASARLARQKARSGHLNAKMLGEIERLCTLTEFNLTRALNTVQDGAANSLLMPSINHSTS
jgi:hypothetical protein